MLALYSAGFNERARACLYAWISHLPPQVVMEPLYQVAFQIQKPAVENHYEVRRQLHISPRY